MLYIVPELDLTIVMTSDHASPAGRSGHRDNLHGLVADIIAVVVGGKPAQVGDPGES